MIDYNWKNDDSLKVLGFDSPTVKKVIEKVKFWNDSNDVIIISRCENCRGIARDYSSNVVPPPYWAEPLFDKEKAYIFPEEGNRGKRMVVVLEGTQEWCKYIKDTFYV